MEARLENVFRSFFESTSLVETQLTSFNMFLHHYLPEFLNTRLVINKNPHVHTLEFSNCYIETPRVMNVCDHKTTPLYPMNARDTNESYLANVYVDVLERTTDITTDSVAEVHHTRFLLFQHPIMVCSQKCNLWGLSEDDRIRMGECQNDLGGYFIINGVERVITPQIGMRYNVVTVHKQKDSEKKKQSKYKYVAEIRSMSSETRHQVLISAMITTDSRHIYFGLPSSHIKEPIPAGIIFKALGFNNNEIIELIGLSAERFPALEKLYRFILRDCFFIQDYFQLLSVDKQVNYEKAKELFKTLESEKQLEYKKKMQLSAIEFISKRVISTNVQAEKKMDFAWQLVENELFPHLGASATIKEKACFLGYILNHLISVEIGVRNVDDRDHYINKHVDTTGVLCYNLFQTIFKKFLISVRNDVNKRTHLQDMISVIAKHQAGITKNIQSCFATGNWGVQRTSSHTPTGVSQVLDRMTYKAMLSHLRRVILPIASKGNVVGVRQIVGSYYGFICTYETPEGGKCGSVMNLAMTATVSNCVSSTCIYDTIEKLFADELIPIEVAELDKIAELSRVMLNGAIIGFVDFNEQFSPRDFITRFIENPIIKAVKRDVSIVYDALDCDVKISCDEGRFIRPLIKLRNNELPPLTDKWHSLIDSGEIVYVDVAEQEQAVIAMTPDALTDATYDYCEIHPCCKTGVIAGMIPFYNHSPSPRNTYVSSMNKQAVGIYAINYRARTDTVSYVLNYPQRQIVSTMMTGLVKYHEMPSCINAVIAITCIDSGNTDDSLIFNESAINMGMFDLTRFFTIECEEQKCGTQSREEICLPPLSQAGFKRNGGNYRKLDKNGLPRVGCKYVKGDIILGKVAITSDKIIGGVRSVETKTDMSRKIETLAEEGIVDKVYVLRNTLGQKIVKIVMRELRILQIGDKLASGCAQKGTIGRIMKEIDMPFTSSGLVPDVIINALAFPSRMTVNMLIEILLGKKCCIEGVYGDATPFTKRNHNVADKICAELEKHGVERHGWEEMMCGVTGEQYSSLIYVGVSAYQRLRHQVMDKEHARSTGNVNIATRQSNDGRKNAGGFRIGNMETDCIISHGISAFLSDRLFYCSDRSYITVCANCGCMMIQSKECSNCKHDRIVTVKMSYSSKLLFQQLMSCMFDLRFLTRKPVVLKVAEIEEE